MGGAPLGSRTEVMTGSCAGFVAYEWEEAESSSVCVRGRRVLRRVCAWALHRLEAIRLVVSFVCKTISKST